VFHMGSSVSWGDFFISGGGSVSEDSSLEPQNRPRIGKRTLSLLISLNKVKTNEMASSGGSGSEIVVCAPLASEY